MSVFLYWSGYISIFIYVFALFWITCYCLMQFHLLVIYKKNKRPYGSLNSKDNLDNDHLPFVTIQLPIYNEKFVIERLLDNITRIDYPKNKFEIHILDDSTDQTSNLASKKAKEIRAKGFEILHIQRENREGYKAGALKEGMSKVKGEFIAIFDADFLPKPDFLKKTLPYFENSDVAVVQTRWEHINQKFSLLTELQAFQLNVHFTVEQSGRESGDLLLQFNGTAGVWRKAAIDQSGGWEADTLTEDLDLSYRAQLKGWKIIYLENVVSPAELPAEMHGLKSQQFRWMKGGAETAKKMLPFVWKSKLSFLKKVHASFHLLSSSVFLFVFILGLISVPVGLFLESLHIDERFFIIFILGLLAIVAVYYVANVQVAWPGENSWRKRLKFIAVFPVFLAVSMGMSFHNSIAVIQGFIGKKSAFIRTPKFNIDKQAKDHSLIQNSSAKMSKTIIFEGILALYFAFSILLSLVLHNYSFVILHVLLLFGYSTIFYFSIKHLSFINNKS